MKHALWYLLKKKKQQKKKTVLCTFEIILYGLTILQKLQLYLIQILYYLM